MSEAQGPGPTAHLPLLMANTSMEVVDTIPEVEPEVEQGTTHEIHKETRTVSSAAKMDISSNIARQKSNCSLKFSFPVTKDRSFAIILSNKYIKYFCFYIY